MDFEDRKKLQRALELSEENNKLIKKLVRAMRWARLFRVIYWIAIIAVSVGAYYYVQPYVTKIIDISGSLKGSIDSINNAFRL